jgi:hypothetical protein
MLHASQMGENILDHNSSGVNLSDRYAIGSTGGGFDIGPKPL